MENILQNFNDIYVPDGVSAFPLAYGWYVLFIALIAVVLAIKAIIWSIKTSKKRYALNKIKNIKEENPVVAGAELSEIIRRVCCVKYDQATSLFGKEWANFLKKKTKAKISQNVLDLLIFAPFMDKNDKKYSSKDVVLLKEFCKQWVEDNL